MKIPGISRLTGKGTSSLLNAAIVVYLLFFLSQAVSGTFLVEQGGTNWVVNGYTSSQDGEDWYPGTLSTGEKFTVSPYTDTAADNHSIIFHTGADNALSKQLDIQNPPPNIRVTRSEDPGELSISQNPEGDWAWSSSDTDGGVLVPGFRWSKVEVNPAPSGPDLFLDTPGNLIDLDNDQAFTIYRRTPFKPYNPSPGNGEFIESDSVTLSARYDDPNGDSGTLTFYEDSGATIGSCSASDGNRCSVSWSGYSGGQQDWYVVAEDSTGLKTRGFSWYFVHNSEPSVDSLDSPPEGSTVNGTSAKLEATVSDPDGNDLVVEFFNNETGSKIGEVSVSGTSGGTTASLDWSGLTRGDSYDWHVEVSDPWETVQSSRNSSFYVNQLPTARYPVPEHNSLSDSTPTTLEITSNDPEGEDVNVFFFNASDDTLIGKSATDASGVASTDWQDLDLGETYSWYVKASDGNENLTSKQWSFKRALSEEFRAETRIDYRYTSVITRPGNPVHVFFTVRNRVKSSKTLNTSLSGVNAEFLDGGWYRQYTLGPESQRRFQISVNPDSVGRYTLDVKTENEELGISHTESIPVYSRETVPGSPTREVPGLGMMQLAVIAALSTVLFFCFTLTM